MKRLKSKCDQKNRMQLILRSLKKKKNLWKWANFFHCSHMKSFQALGRRPRSKCEVARYYIRVRTFKMYSQYEQKCQLFSILMQHFYIFFFRIEMKSRNRAEQKKPCYSAVKCASALSFEAEFIGTLLLSIIVRCPSIQVASLAKQQFRFLSWTSKHWIKRKYDF